ncbi:probable E3 ubiquitin-protein ligase MGRN1 [Sitodiplosis mosellana]|uniref:probable E3 ubiquitin-protein ligase MGRN1 n=1 Tax=Sitodiplosis mosellana TaxID=263140 RepID=UPI002445265D|nr:probable E3 ubiquitin-protein ligase MGRN1 [Sitodiplosis mosellana]
MGTSLSRQNAAVEEADVTLNHPYKYPPRTGTYFGTHFIMGGERFDTPQPEAYLFGENGDLNFLGSRPTAFPYPPPQANEPTKTLKSLINIRKESVRFVKVADNSLKNSNEPTNDHNNLVNIEFVFDSDAKCAIQIFYFCTEEVTATGLTYVPRDPKMTSEVYHCKRGVNQTFLQTSHVFNPSLYTNDLCYSSDRDIYPVVINCVADEGPEDSKQSHTTICVVDHHSDGTYGLRALKQKIFVDGLCYLLQEIYGIENKYNNKQVNIDDDNEDNSGECVICMSDTRDTLILPCRHLCLCNSCADSLRYQANNCPICRAPFRALLQIRAVQKSSSGAHTNITTPQQQALQDTNAENVPPGYIAVSLIEALNGPTPNSTSIKSQLDMVGTDPHNETDSIKSAAEALNRCDDSINDKARAAKDKNITPEIKMSVLLPKEDNNNGKVSNSLREKAQRQKSSGQTAKQQNRDSLHLVNEKNATNLQPTEQDDDSETENLSPLLYHKNKKSQMKHGKRTVNASTAAAVTATTQFQTSQPQTALHIDGVNESIDDTDTDIEEREIEKNTRFTGKQRENVDTDGNNICSTEDSDYFTPEDPHTTILSPLCPDKNKGNDKTRSKESLSSSAAPSPLVALKESSLPDSPSSSADSYSSSSSTRKLLSAPLHELQITTAATTATIPTPSLAASRIIDIKVRDDKKISIEKAVDV